MVPQFKPTAALVIISGMCLGGESGFLIGAMSMFVSNLFFGQGPWTPWQMLAMGLLGLLAGVIFKKSKPDSSILPLCIFGVVSVFVVYGGIMNSASVLMYQAQPSLPMFAASIAAGLSFDAIHAASTLIFLLVAANPIRKKIERIKKKYGLLL